MLVNKHLLEKSVPQNATASGETEVVSDTQFKDIIQFPTGRKLLPSAVWICGLNNREANPPDFRGKINV